MHTRKAARVLPEPVGAAISVSRPAAISVQPPACGGVGPSWNRRSNHVETIGWNPSIILGTVAPLADSVSPGRDQGRPALPRASAGQSGVQAIGLDSSRLS